jgi:prepilin signal peptidase PulO-like enzyme (type II secretory pathway)
VRPRDHRAENIPVISWLGCAAAALVRDPISARYPAIELVTAG